MNSASKDSTAIILGRSVATSTALAQGRRLLVKTQASALDDADVGLHAMKLSPLGVLGHGFETQQQPFPAQAQHPRMASAQGPLEQFSRLVIGDRLDPQLGITRGNVPDEPLDVLTRERPGRGGNHETVWIITPERQQPTELNEDARRIAMP